MNGNYSSAFILFTIKEQKWPKLLELTLELLIHVLPS
jgi:hypothetical protein